MNTTTRSTTENAASAMHNKVDAAAGAAKASVEKASDAARPAVDYLAAGAHEAVNKVASAATHTAEAIDAKGDQLREAQTHFAAMCREHLRDRPLTTLGMAVAAGFVLNWMLSKR